MLVKLTSRLKAASCWARDHRGPARALLIAAHLLLAVLAWSAGAIWLRGAPEAGCRALGWSAAGLAVLGAFLHPHRATAAGRHAGYNRRKSLEGLVVLCGMALIALQGSGQACAVLHLPASEARAAARVGSRSEARSVREALMQRWDEASNKLPLVVKIVLTILILVLGIAACLGVMALSCSVACSGAPFLAVLVFGGGLTLVTLGAVYLLERVLRGKRYAERLRRREERYKRLWKKRDS